MLWAILLLLAGPAIPPSGDAYVPLFVIERSTNANVVHYDAWVTRSGDFNPREPVVAYWIMRAADGQREDLNLFEKRTAYGFKIMKDASTNSFRMSLAAREERIIRVTMVAGVPRAETRIGSCNAYLQRVFIQTKPERLRFNPVAYADFFGIDTTTGATCRERLTP